MSLKCRESLLLSCKLVFQFVYRVLLSDFFFFFGVCINKMFTLISSSLLIFMPSEFRNYSSLDVTVSSNVVLPIYIFNPSGINV